jgi:hypothetical protein
MNESGLYTADEIDIEVKNAKWVATRYKY